MEAMFKVMTLLPWTDWAAVVVFFAGWVGYAWFARNRAQTRPSILASTNRIRRLWMLQITYREVRVVDGAVIQNLSTSPSFFASTTILIIGGLLAVLGTSDKATELVKEIPFTARTSVLIFDLKLILLLVLFVHAFFRFTWSMRQYTFGALMIGSAPEAKMFAEQGLSREAFADRAGRVVGLAAETFNDGLRAYYFSFAAIGWFFSPLIFVCATAGVIYVLFQREFKSDMLEVLNS
ncbi:MAG TPA: DUF599 domain-containing protein [Rhizobacter sp.]|nr:DUF599 domain-containing protein [Rhizobacter sp.]